MVQAIKQVKQVRLVMEFCPPPVSVSETACYRRPPMWAQSVRPLTNVADVVTLLNLVTIGVASGAPSKAPFMTRQKVKNLRVVPKTPEID